LSVLLPRRRFFRSALGAVAASAMPRAAFAQSYPVRPVRIVVTFPPGGSNDIHARLIGQWLSERMGQPFVVENRPGASGNLGMEAVVRSPADGATLVFLSVSLAINAATYERLNYDLVRDVAPVAGLFRSHYVMLVNPSLPVAAVPELIAYAKANPGKVNMGSNGVGATGHLCGELLGMMAGVKLQHVPYRGEGPALTDLIAGQIQVMFATTSGSTEYVRNGTLRSLAVTSAGRSRGLPNVPPLGETVPGYEVSTWGGIGAPARTPPQIVELLNREINAGLASPGIRNKYDDLGLDAMAGPPAEFRRLIVEDIEKWRKVVRFAGIKLG
jgi:tripartite-type tricarboxylate transporter receptor subunit TctC